MRRWRIHGDNVIECDRALALIVDALGAKTEGIPSAPYAPRYVVRPDAGEEVEITCLPGYGRWGVDIPAALRASGASLREAGDAVITELVDDRERVLLAIEFCSALPAGNNAWQRSGRALAFAEAAVPYLYFAEVGGVELDESRTVKAPRFPNPIVPFSYVCASVTLETLCLPVYLPSPSSSGVIRQTFESAFGYGEAVALTAKILNGEDASAEVVALRDRALVVVQTLSSGRQRRTTLAGEEWTGLLYNPEFSAKSQLLVDAGLSATKRAPTKVKCTETFRRLVAVVNEVGCVAPGAVDIPIAVVPGARRSRLRDAIGAVYGETVALVTDWLESSEDPVAIVWVTGFKPGGEDSRPDRGLLPLTRMLFGEGADVLTVLWGPGHPITLAQLRNDPAAAATDNGLLEAVVNLSDAVIVDSANLGPPFALLHTRATANRGARVEFNASSAVPFFSEHDIDSVLHRLFSCGDVGVFESMCNPPGGDWSGLSLTGTDPVTQYRWTSLPRVSGPNSKRPDHVAQLLDIRALLAVESKTAAAALETSIGPRMSRYVENLLSVPPTIHRTGGNDWDLVTPNDTVAVAPFEVVRTAGAFVWSGPQQLVQALDRGELDVALGVEFFAQEERALLHVAARPGLETIVAEFRRLAERIIGIEVQEH